MNDNKIEYPDYLDSMPDEVKALWEKLKDSQKLFVVYYAETENARQSMIRAGYSKEGARQNGYRMITSDYIKPIVDWMSKYIIDNALDTSISTAAERMKILTEMTRATIADYTQADGTIDLNAMGANPANIKELTTRLDEEGKLTKTIKMYSSVDAVKELNKMQGSHAADKLRHVDKDDNDVKPQVPIAIVTKDQLMSQKDLDDIGYTET